MKLIIDWDFEEQMVDKEMNSLSKQLMYGYAANKKSVKPVNLIFTGWKSKKLTDRLVTHGSQNWVVDIHEQCYIEIFDKESLVYLTADSENTVDKFEEDKIYIVGGIVDHNRHKNIWFNKAKEQGISHAKFPIKENVNIGDYSTVLTVNQVMGTKNHNYHIYRCDTSCQEISSW